MCPLTGDLLSEEREPRPKKYPAKLQQALQLCNQPYNLLSISSGDQDQNLMAQSAKFGVRKIIYIAKLNFFIARQYAAFKNPVFENSEQAISHFRKMHSEQNGLCLPRALFAAKTSQAFESSGVVFLGVFLPSSQMHAWVIENQKQPDSMDNIWLHYRPVAAIC
jgi:hypothetical protein